MFFRWLRVKTNRSSFAMISILPYCSLCSRSFWMFIGINRFKQPLKSHEYRSDPRESQSTSKALEKNGNHQHQHQLSFTSFIFRPDSARKIRWTNRTKHLPLPKVLDIGSAQMACFSVCPQGFNISVPLSEGEERGAILR